MNGANGANGDAGANGQAGTNGTNGTNGTDGQTGQAGQQGDVGPAGDAGAAGPPGDADNIAGLVASYRGAGTDLSGNGHDATVHGTVPLVADRFGVPSSAASFDGTAANYLEVTNTLLPLAKTPRTVSVWFKTTTSFAPNAGSLVNWGTSLNANGERFGLLVDGTHDFFVGQNADLVGTIVVNDGKWHNLTTTFDGTTIMQWVDGMFSVQGTPTLNTVGQVLRIGATTADRATQEPFTGAIDDLRIYSRVLTRSERGLLITDGGWP